MGRLCKSDAAGSRGGSTNEWKFHSFWCPDCYGVCRPVEMQHVKVFTTDLVKSLKHWEPIQASEHPQFK